MKFILFPILLSISFMGDVKNDFHVVPSTDVGESTIEYFGGNYMRYKSCTCKFSISFTSLSWCRGNKLVCRNNGTATCTENTIEGFCDCSTCADKK